MLTRLRDAIGGAADKLSLRLPNGWTVTGYLFDRDYDPTRIPEGWTVDGILIDHDRPGTRRSLSATRLRFLWYEIRTGQTLTDGDGPVQFGTVRYKIAG